MAWIKLDQTTFTHRKTMLAAELLDISEVYTVAHLAALWTWALDNAPQGDLPNSVRIIAKAAQWQGDAGQFVNAIVSAGFLDALEAGGFCLHDWQDYAGNLIEKRQQNAARMKKAREEHKPAEDKQAERTCDERATNVQNTNGERAGARVEKRRLEKTREEAPLRDPAGSPPSKSQMAKRSFPPTEPAKDNQPAHLLYLVEIANSGLILPQSIGREAKAAASMLEAGYEEAAILKHYQEQRDRKPNGYSLHLLAIDLPSLVGRRNGAGSYSREVQAAMIATAGTEGWEE